jgi:hypothetical protein
MLALVELATVRAVPSRVTFGVLAPKLLPLMVICVPAVFSVTLMMYGEWLPCAAASPGTASSTKAKRDTR